MFQITERSPYPARALSSILYSAWWSWESEYDQSYISSIAGQTAKTWWMMQGHPETPKVQIFFFHAIKFFCFGGFGARSKNMMQFIVGNLYL